MKFKISKNLYIKKNSRPLIIAEISANHIGKKKLFLDHIKSAAKNGADLIKIQTYEPEDITLKSRNKNFLIKSGTWKGKNLWDLYSKGYTPFSWHKDAFKLAKKLKIPIFSSPFSKRAVDLLESLKTPIYKIASFEITDLNLIDYVASKGKPIIISTGMATLNEINKAIKTIEKHHKKIVILYCVSGYPTKEKDTNVLNIKKFQKLFKNYIIGISDHTDNIYSALSSIVLGASVIEKHFIVNKKINSLDKLFSIDSKQLKRLKLFSTKMFLTLKSSNIGPKKNELNSLKLRRSIFAIKDINKGEKFTKMNIGCFRPKIGLGAENYFKIIGKKSKRKILKSSPVF